MIVLHDAVHTAVKYYECDTYPLWDRCGFDQTDVSAADWQIVQAAMAKDWRIEPGDKYRKVIYVDGGEFVTYRAWIEMDDLCQRLDLFDE